MAQPPTYNRSTSFTNYQAANPTAPLSGSALDVEFNNVKTTLDALLANVKVIQNDDTTLKNGSVGLNQLSSALTLGFSSPTTWGSGIAYLASPASTVFHGSGIYICKVSHTSGTFATDLAAGDWQLILDLSAIPITAASQVSVVASGTLTTDVQGSLQALDSGKAATSHTHPASAISDSTGVGRTLLTAANVAAQQTALGLGSLAFLNTVPVTQITAQLAFTNPISPATLSTNQNDWSPTGWASAARVQVNANTAINITGFLATTDGDFKLLENTGTSTITLVVSSASSSAANRITGSVNHQLRANEACILVYDASIARWFVFGASATQNTTQQKLTSGTGATYTTPGGVVQLRIRMVGGGGGGGGGGTAGSGGSNGGSGGNTIFNSIVATGGSLGQGATGGGIGAGGAGGASGAGSAFLRVGGSWGANGTVFSGNIATGGGGGTSPFGGAGANSSTSGQAAIANSGSGGGGGPSQTAAGAGGGGGGSGEYVEIIIDNPAASYTYTIGGGGAAGTGGGGANGGTGGSGIIIVEERYN